MSSPPERFPVLSRGHAFVPQTRNDNVGPPPGYCLTANPQTQLMLPQAAKVVEARAAN
jgi:hypothetical protein